MGVGGRILSPAGEKGKTQSVFGQQKQYPEPIALHEEVVKDTTLFNDTLKQFHLLLGNKFTVPVIGGKELNLHVLYVEVTARGGYEKVVEEKKWREVGNVFRFSPTTTSASFVLKKHYFSLLFHYEQVYFFKKQGTIDSPEDVPENLGNSEPALLEFPSEGKSNGLESVREGFTAIGTIDGKFDCGYLVSVKMGSEILKGVLYHPDETASPEPISQSKALVPYAPLKHTGRRRRRRNRRRGDPNFPKPNRSGYNFFFAEKHNMLKSQFPNREREFTKMIGKSWSNLSPDERMVYQTIGMKDKERYKRELKEYRERQKLMQDDGAEKADN